MRARKKEADGHAQEEFLRRRELIAVIHLLPHVEVVVGSSVEFERYAADPVEHEIGTKHVGDVGQRPCRIALYAGDDAEEYLEGNDQDYMDCPGTCEFESR